MTLLTATNLTQNYGKKIAVNHINLKINAGQLVAFLGPNGAGKTTTIKMLTGITYPKGGEIKIGSWTPKEHEYQHQIGVVFQNSVLDGDLTVKQNLMLRAKMYHDFDANFLNHLIKIFSVETILKQKYNQLSGGQKRRIDIIRALVNKPKLLFLDEPTTALDIQTRNKIWDVLNQLRQQYQLTIILTTHYLEEANQADYVYVIDHGEIIAQDTVKDLKAKYGHHILSLYTQNVETLRPYLKPEWHPQITKNKVTVMMPSLSTTMSLLTEVQPLINDMEYHPGDMNDIFIALTGKEIR